MKGKGAVGSLSSDEQKDQRGYSGGHANPCFTVRHPFYACEFCHCRYFRKWPLHRSCFRESEIDGDQSSRHMWRVLPERHLRGGTMPVVGPEPDTTSRL